jgi:CrcB protein
VNGGAEIVAVAIGGVVGTALRWAIDAVLPHNAVSFPWSTLIVNTFGAFLLGCAVSLLWATSPRWLRAGLGTGLLGSFTTFSAIMVSLVSLGVNGQWLIASGYLASTLLAGFLAAFAGLRAGQVRPTGLRSGAATSSGASPALDRETE